MPCFVYLNLNIAPQNSTLHIVQLDRTKFKVLGEMNYVLIRLAFNSKFHQVIDILVDDIPDFYSLILSGDWWEKLHGYFATNWSHLWLPYNGSPNKIWFELEKHMKYSVTNFDDENEQVTFTNKILGTYSVESLFGYFNAQLSPFLINSVNSQIENFS